MNYKLSLITILFLSTLQAEAKIVKSHENNSSKASKEREERKKDEDVDPETKALETQERKLSLHNSLTEESLKNEYAGLLKRLQKIRWEKELLEEEFALKELKVKNSQFEETTKQAQRLEKLENEVAIAELNAQKKLKHMETEKSILEFKNSKLESEIEEFQKIQERNDYIDTTPSYLENPVTKDNKLIISDRKILLNGVIRKDMSENIVNQIHYFNNKDSKKPIFVVIDSSPGGSIMYGYRILKAIQNSKAPVYVLVRSFAASMAAVILTLSENSYAYEQAVILHHQPSHRSFGYSNLTEEREKYESLKKWWELFGEPIASKMGITLDEFKNKMYEHSSHGDWQEFAKEAKALKWVNNIIESVEDTSLLTKPEMKNRVSLLNLFSLKEHLNDKGKPVVYLPHLSPVDAYFIYNPDGYYQVQ